MTANPQKIKYFKFLTRRLTEFDFEKVGWEIECNIPADADPKEEWKKLEDAVTERISTTDARSGIVGVATPTPPIAGPQPRVILVSPLEPHQPMIERLPWLPGQRAGREWVRIPEHSQLEPVIKLMESIDQGQIGYHTIGKYVYRIEGDFLGRYPKREGGKT
jgi:hypothetical protein